MPDMKHWSPKLRLSEKYTGLISMWSFKETEQVRASLPLADGIATRRNRKKAEK